MPLSRSTICAIAECMIAHEEELTALDQAIGDGDHGTNMRVGFEQVRAEARRLAALELPAALDTIGHLLLNHIGGASGPLYATLFLELARALPPQPSREDLTRGLGRAVEALRARGRTAFGEKTLFDVWEPVRQALERGTPGRESIKATAEEAALATIGRQAQRGRAAYLGERSIGHMDPGARSSAILIASVCDHYTPLSTP
jgi:dihydroxyacetone kinase-like protein